MPKKKESQTLSLFNEPEPPPQFVQDVEKIEAKKNAIHCPRCNKSEPVMRSMNPDIHDGHTHFCAMCSDGNECFYFTPEIKS